MTKRYDTYKDSGVQWLTPRSLECDTDGLLDEIELSIWK